MPEYSCNILKYLKYYFDNLEHVFFFRSEVIFAFRLGLYSVNFWTVTFSWLIYLKPSISQSIPFGHHQILLFIYLFLLQFLVKIWGARGNLGMVGPSVGLDLQQITNILCEAPRFPQIFIMFIVFITQTIFSLNDQKPCLLLPSFFVYIIFYFTFI